MIRRLGTEGDDACVVLRGDFQLSDSVLLQERLLRVVGEHHHRLVVDLSAVDSMTTSAAAALIVARQHQQRQGGEVILCGLHGQVRSLFEISRLDRFFQVTPDRRAALES
ncbi:MAG: STAS domain-containing protein [Phycisphaerae bacterium]|nr:STAS domain-containing protein [Phycisphaerae bacterium]